MPAKQTVDVEGRRIALSNLEKPLYPGNGFTKAHVVDYYTRIAGWLLPYYAGRPVTMLRFPDGVRGKAFYEKDAPKYTPEWIHTTLVPRQAGGQPIRYICINDLPTLIWCANLASLELHPFLHRAPDIQQPTSVVFDLDPGEGADLLTCAHVAFLLKDVLSRLGLESLPKVSGSKGIQVYAPLNTGVTYADTRPFARALAQLLAKEHSTLIIAEMAKSERAQKVFIDWSQNSDFKTTVGVYSLRANRDRPFVSMPVAWDELERALQARKTNDLYWEPGPALARLSEIGDLFAPLLELKQPLPKSLTSALPTTPRARGPRSRKRAARP